MALESLLSLVIQFSSNDILNSDNITSYFFACFFGLALFTITVILPYKTMNLEEGSKWL